MPDPLQETFNFETSLSLLETTLVQFNIDLLGVLGSKIHDRDRHVDRDKE